LKSDRIRDMAEKKNALTVLVGKCNRCGWNENIKMDLTENLRIWTGLIWLRLGTSCRELVNIVINYPGPR
jgi:hypothetical protein